MSTQAFLALDHVSLPQRFAAVLAGAADEPLIEADGVWRARGFVQDIARRLDTALDAASLPASVSIGFIARNRPAHIAALYALLARGRAVLMLHAYQAPAALAAEVAKLNLAAIIGDDEDWTSELQAIARTSGCLGIRIQSTDDVRPLTVVEGLEIVGANRRVAGDGIAIEMLTSGTTGAPKRVPIRYSTLEQAVNDAGLATVQSGAADAETPYVQFYPLGNISGLYGLITCASHGRRVVLLEKFSVVAWVRAMQAYKPESFVSLPPAALRMVLDADVPRDLLSHLTAIRCGSAPLDPALQRRFEAYFGVPILINYGATEFCGVVANWTLEDHRKFADAKRGSVGRARPGVQLRIADVTTDAILSPDETGRLEVLAPRISSEWVRTTDLATIDADGFLFLRGRADSVIIRGGFKVFPDAVTQVLRLHPGVRDAAVIGAPDERLGEVPIAAVELRAGAPAPTEGELIARVREELSPQAAPLRVEIMQALPRTGSMKVDIAALKSLLLAGRDA